jgi:uncharacterized protein YaiL (DUF2058 family)
MGNSLQDQLRALGLAGREPERRQRKGRPARKAKEAGDSAGQPRHDRELTLDEAYAMRQAEEQRQADTARRRKLEEERRRRQVNDSIREIVNARRLNRDDAEIARNFMFNGRIRKIHVTTEQQQALAADRLGIVYLAGRYHLLEPDAIQAVRLISAEHVVDLGDEATDEDPDHPVPDDLVW